MSRYIATIPRSHTYLQNFISKDTVAVLIHND